MFTNRKFSLTQNLLRYSRASNHSTQNNRASDVNGTANPEIKPI